jgi:hypothetical protein
MRKVGNGKYENKDTGNGTMENNAPAVLGFYHEYRVCLKRKISDKMSSEQTPEKKWKLH